MDHLLQAPGRPAMEEAGQILRTRTNRMLLPSRSVSSLASWGSSREARRLTT